METLIIENVPQSEVWEKVKEAVGDNGFQLFSFTFAPEGKINIRAVKGLIGEIESDAKNAVAAEL